MPITDAASQRGFAASDSLRLARGSEGVSNGSVAQMSRSLPKGATGFSPVFSCKSGGSGGISRVLTPNREELCCEYC